MDLLRGNIKTLYFKYLSAAFGSALISSIYGIVDMAMVGQYQEPDGTAALAVVAPVWNVIYSIGLLMGIGGSVIFSTKRGSGMSADGEDEQYFTAAVIGSVILAALAWVGLILFERPLLMFFGTDETLLALAQRYMIPVKVVFPLFLFNQMLAAFLRNDGAPALATLGVLSGGIFNVFGDWFFVFPCDMGVYGAGLATALGSAVSFLVMLTHFASRKNTLRLVKPKRLARKLWKIAVTGFSSFFIDMAMGILTVLFNRQIMQYLGSDALAIYGDSVHRLDLSSAAPRLGRARDLRPHHQRQHIRPVLRVQRRTGIPAHHFDEFRRGERGSHPRDAARCAVDGRIFRRFLDGAERGVPESLHPHFYEPDGDDLGDGPGHHPRVCDLIPAAAVQHLLDVLFPGHLTAEGGAYRVGRARTRHQRCTDPDAAASCGRGFALVRHAHHGACHRRLRCGVHPQIHRAARRKSHLTKRGHRRIIMAEF